MGDLPLLHSENVPKLHILLKILSFYFSFLLSLNTFVRNKGGFNIYGKMEVAFKSYYTSSISYVYAASTPVFSPGSPEPL